MFAQFAITLAMIAPSAPIPKDVSPKGPPPLVAELKPNDDGKILVMIRREENRKVPVTRVGAVQPNNPDGVETREVTTLRMMQVDLSEVKDLQVTTAAGKTVDTKDALAKIKDGAVVVMTTDGKKVDPNFLRVFKDDTLVLVSPEFIGAARLGTGATIRPLPINPGGIKILPALIPPAAVPAPVEKEEKK